MRFAGLNVAKCEIVLALLPEMHDCDGMSKKFLTDSDINEVVAEVLPHFHFNLTSRSRISEIAEVAQEKLSELGFVTRRSLAVLVAKKAKASFFGQIEITQNRLNH